MLKALIAGLYEIFRSCTRDNSQDIMSMYDGKLVFIITGVNFHTSVINFAIITGFPGKVIYYSLPYRMKKMIIYPPSTQLNIHPSPKKGGRGFKSLPNCSPGLFFFKEEEVCLIKSIDLMQKKTIGA